MPQDFSPDGSRLLVTSDSGREFAELQAYELASGGKSTVYAATGT